jgi:hypothetical protein
VSTFVVVEIKRVDGLKQNSLLIDLRFNMHAICFHFLVGYCILSLFVCALRSLKNFKCCASVENENAVVVICMPIKINLFFEKIFL